MHLSATAKGLIVALLIVGGIFVGVVMFFLNIKAVSDRAAQKVGEVEVTEKQVNQFESRREIISNNKREMSQVQSYFVEPELEGTVDFLSEVEALASTTGASIEAQSVNEVAGKTDRTKQLDLTVNAEGTWRQVYHTITLIENMSYNIALSNVQLKQTGTRAPAVGTSTSPRSSGTIWSTTLDLTVAKRMATTSATSTE